MSWKIAKKWHGGMKFVGVVIGGVIVLWLVLSGLGFMGSSITNHFKWKKDFERIQELRVRTPEQMKEKCAAYKNHPFYEKGEYKDLQKACKLADDLLTRQHRIRVNGVSGIKSENPKFKVEIYSSSMAGDGKSIVYGSEAGVASEEIGDEAWCAINWSFGEAINLDIQVESKTSDKVDTLKKYTSIFALRDIIQVHEYSVRGDLKDLTNEGKITVECLLEGYDSTDWAAFDKYFKK